MKYYIIAGEASGDLHGSNLMKGLYECDPQADIRYWGGAEMDKVYAAHRHGNGKVVDYVEGAVMGFAEVLAKGRELLGRLSRCKKDILSFQPDAVILIDYPGFNFKIAKFAHKRGFKVFYYIAPKVWASREGRIRKLKRDVDKLFIVFPFEIEYFQKKGVPFTYRGNPLVDAIDASKALNESRADFLRRNSLEDVPSIALLAGSRGMELSFMLPRLAAFADMMHAIPEYSHYIFTLAGAPGRTEKDYAEILKGRESYLKLLFNETYGVIRHAEAAVINSGTASLEAALIGTPQIVGYGSNSRISYMIAKRIVKVKWISLGNLIEERTVFKEIIQDDFTPENVLAEVRELIENKEYRQAMLEGYASIRSKLGGGGASKAVAEAVIADIIS